MKKDAGVAAVLNTIIPGLGWIYIESLFLGIISIILDVVFFSLILHNPLFGFVWLVFWIISIVSVCNKTKVNEYRIEENKISTNHKESSKSKIKITTVNCEKCNGYFDVLGKNDAECPHCGHLYKNQK